MKGNKNKAAKKAKVKKQKPLSILGLLFTILKSVVTSIPTMWKSILIRSIISFLVVAIFSFYSIAIKNEGFGNINFKPGTFWSYMVNTGGNEGAFNTICFVTTYTLTIIYSKIRRSGIKRFFQEILEVFPWTAKCIHESGKATGPVIFYSISLVMLIGVFNTNNIMFITLAITLFFEFASKENGLVSMFSLATWNDFHRIFKRKIGIQPLNKAYAGLICLSLFASMVVLAVVPINRTRLVSIILLILCLALGSLLSYNKISNKAAANILFIALCGAAAYGLSLEVLADNGGYTEGGGSLTSYVGTAGSAAVVFTSVVSGITGFLGGILGVGIGIMQGNINIKDNWEYGQGFGQALGEDVAYVGVETVSAIHDVIKDPYIIIDTMEGSFIEVGESIGAAVELGGNAIDWIDENVTAEIAIDTASGMIRDINGVMSGEYAADWMQEQITEFCKDPDKYYEDTMATLERAGTLTSGALSKVEKWLDKMRTDPRAAYETIKAISPVDSIKNMIDPNKGLAERLLNTGFAVMDVADILVGFGIVNIATEAVEQTVKQGIKHVVREGAEEITQRVGQEIAEEVGQRVTREGLEQAGTRITREGMEEVGQRVTQEGIEEVGQRTAQEVTEEVGQRTAQEVTEEVGQRTAQEATEEVGQRTAQEATEEVGQRTAQEATEEAGQRTAQEATEEAGQRTAQEATEEAGQRTAQEATEEAGQRTAQEGAEESRRWTPEDTKKELDEMDHLTQGQKDELMDAQRQYDEALESARDETQRMIDKSKTGDLDVDEVINSRGSINTRAAQNGDKIGDAGRAAASDSEMAEFVEKYNRTLKDEVHRPSYDEVLEELGNGKYKGDDLRIKEISTPGKGDGIYRPGGDNPIPNKINGDNDFVVQKFNESTGRWEEIPQKDFDQLYYDSYSKNSGFTPDRGREMYPDADWDSVANDPAGQNKLWAEMQGETPTDVYNPEAMRDFSTEATTHAGGAAPDSSAVTQVQNASVDNPASLYDPQQLGMAEEYKFSEPWSRGDIHSQTEALEQLDKSGNLLQKLEDSYRNMGRNVPELPQNFKEALEVVSNRNLAPSVREAKIQQLGFRSMEDLSSGIGMRFEGLKLY